MKPSSAPVATAGAFISNINGHGFGRVKLHASSPRQRRVAVATVITSGQHVVRFSLVVSYAEIIPEKVDTRL